MTQSRNKLWLAVFLFLKKSLWLVLAQRGKEVGILRGITATNLFDMTYRTRLGIWYIGTSY